MTDATLDWLPNPTVEVVDHFGDDVQFAVIAVSGFMGRHHNGYVCFPTRLVKEPGYNGLLTYVPVHGGITFANERDDGRMVYGFDCAHGGDETDPRCSDPVWLREQVVLMARGVTTAAKFEDDYLLATGDNAKRAEIIDAYHEALGADFDLTDNFGAMLSVLGGEL